MKATHLYIVSVLRHMLDIPAVLHEVGPPQPNLQVFDLVVFKLEVEVCISGEEQ